MILLLAGRMIEPQILERMKEERAQLDADLAEIDDGVGPPLQPNELELLRLRLNNLDSLLQFSEETRTS